MVHDWVLAHLHDTAGRASKELGHVLYCPDVVVSSEDLGPGTCGEGTCEMVTAEFRISCPHTDEQTAYTRSFDFPGILEDLIREAPLEGCLPDDYYGAWGSGAPE
jgi:hypothetical protein